MNSGVNSDIFGQQNKRSRDNRNGSLSAVTSTAGSTLLRTPDKTQVLTKRKLSQDSPQSIKKLRSPVLPPQQGLNFSTLFKRKFGTPQHNKIDKYFMRKEVEHFDVGNSKSSCLHENTFESVAHISQNSDGADCFKNCRSHNSGGKTVEHHVPGGEYVVDSVIVVSDDDDDDDVPGGEYVVDSVIVVSDDDDDDDDPVVVSDECDAAKSLNEKWDGNVYDLDCCDLHDTESTKVTTFVAILSDGNHTKRAHHPNTMCGTKTSAQANMRFAEDVQELKKGKSLQPHVAGGIFVGDCVIEISSDDDSNDGDPVVVITDESDAESLTEEREGVGSPNIYDLDSYDLYDIESTEIKTYTCISSDQSDTKRAHHSGTQNVCCTKASAQGNMHFTCKRKELVDSPGLHMVNVKKPVPFDVPGQEQVGSSCSDEPATIKSLTCNSAIFGSPTAEVETASGPDSEPVFVSDLSEPEVSSNCDDSKPLVVTGSDGDSVVNSKLVIGSMDSVSVNCVKRDRVLSTNSDEKSLIGCSIPGKELVIDNSPRNEHAFVCSYRKPGATEQLLIAKENVRDPVVVGVCGEKLEVTCEFGKESVFTDILDREPTAVDRSIIESVVVDMSDKGLMNIDSPVTEPSVVNNSVRGNVIVDKPERDLAILSAPDKGCVIGDQDRKLVVLAEEGSSGEMAMIASHAVSDSTDAVNLNEGSASQNTSKINAQNRIGTSGSYDKYPSTSTSAGDGKVGGPVKCDQIIASYQTVMYDHHDRAAARLELRWVPFCCQYSYSCTQQHKSSLWKPSEVCDARSQIMEALMNARQWSCAFHFCCSVTSERSFPSASTVLRILVFILNTHEICLIGSAVSAFKKIVDLHPPCAPDMLRYYTTVLTSTLIENTPCLSDSGIVDGIIYELNDMITFKDLKNEDLPCDSSAVCEDPLVTLNTATEELLDVSAEERAEANKNYATLSHDEKLNRLFIVLEVIVELLEIDLSVFLVKHSFQLRKALIHRSYRPLIVSVLWRTNTVQGIGRLNGICRCIISLYAKCFVHNISFNKWTVIARLLTLVAETVRASERNDELLYPYFGEQCKTLAREVSQCLSGMNPEELVRVLSEMRPSFLTLYVTNFLLSNAVGYETDPSLNTVVGLISTCFLPHDMEAQKLSPQVKTTSNGEVTETKGIINKRDKKGETILHRVCRRNKVYELKELLKDPEVDVNVMDNFGWTALHEAVHYGAVSCVYELLEYKPPPGRCRADVHVQSEDGTTPLIDAVQTNQLESCKLLLKYGGPFLLRAKNRDGKSALDVATSLEMKALLESVGTEDKFLEEEAAWQHGTCSTLVSQLLPVLLHSYLDTYLTLHIESELKNHVHYDNDDINTLPVKRIGRPKLKFDYPRFSKDYKSLRKLKGKIRDESKKVPGSEMIGKFLFLLQ